MHTLFLFFIACSVYAPIGNGAVTVLIYEYRRAFSQRTIVYLVIGMKDPAEVICCSKRDAGGKVDFLTGAAIIMESLGRDGIFREWE